MRRKIDPRRLAFFGLRDLDPAEKSLLTEREIIAYMSAAILGGGVDIGSAMQQHLERNPGGFSVFSADLDGLDPEFAPCVTTAVEGGLTLGHYLTALWALHAIRGKERVLSYEIHEFNPKCLLVGGATTLYPGEVDTTVETIVALLNAIVQNDRE